MRDLHVGESAELYALGFLSAGEREELEEHLATCSDCRRVVGEAEETVLQLEREKLPVPTPFTLDRRVKFSSTRSVPALLPWLAVAAAFILGLLPSIPLLLEREGVRGMHDAASLAMINSHFNHAQFAGTAPNAPPAKLIYARDRSWLYVIVQGNHRFEVDALHGSSTQTLGTTQPAGSASELFMKNGAPNVDTVELRDGGTLVERARLR